MVERNETDTLTESRLAKHERSAVTLMQTNIPNFCLGPNSDSRRDPRATRLWHICVDQLDAAVLAAVVCDTLDLPAVEIENNGAPAWLLAEVRADLPEILDYMAEGSDDGRYWEARNGAPATITFDGVLVDNGEQIPVQLLIHELAHHVECHSLDGQFSGHGDSFTAALRQVATVLWQYLELDRWPDEDWSKIAPLPPQNVTDSMDGALREHVYRTKWQRLLTEAL